MVYSRSRTNIRRPSRRRAVARRRPAYRRRRVLTRRPRARGSPCVCPGDLSPGARFALSQLDPFEPKCLGAKIPDSNTMPSIAISDVEQVASLAPSTINYITGIAFRPGYAGSRITGTPRVGFETTQVDWGATTTSNATDRRGTVSYRDQFEAMRPVSHAVRISSSLAPTSATGFVHIGLSVESAYQNTTSTWQYPTDTAMMSQLAHYKRITLASLTQTPLTVINKWIDDRAFQYQDPRTLGLSTTSTATDNVNHFGFSWCTIVILIEGAPISAASISAEHILLTEALPKKESVVQGTVAASNSPGTMSAVSSMVSEIDFGHTEAGQQDYVTQGLASLRRGADVAGETVMREVALPLLQRVGYAAGMTAVQMAMNAATGRGGIQGVNSNSARLAVNS